MLCFRLSKSELQVDVRESSTEPSSGLWSTHPCELPPQELLPHEHPHHGHPFPGAPIPRAPTPGEAGAGAVPVPTSAETAAWPGGNSLGRNAPIRSLPGPARPAVLLLGEKVIIQPHRGWAWGRHVPQPSGWEHGVLPLVFPLWAPGNSPRLLQLAEGDLCLRLELSLPYQHSEQL